jgi:NAD(P)-dependent dehydrogenase (short-subunit alcohol dehydrogenase family)
VDLNLSGEVAVLTGASRSVGLAVVGSIAAEGTSAVKGRPGWQ